MSVQFYVAGRPAPKGSYSRGKAGSIRPASRFLGAWSAAVIEIGQRYRPSEPYGFALMVQLDFVLDRPKDHYRKDGSLSTPAIGAYPHVPDLDKLVRSTLDALVVAELIANDSQVVEIHASKRYSATRSGCAIGIWPVLP